MAPTKVWPNRAVVCAGCGWTSYPQPVRSAEDPVRVKWELEPSCRNCGTALGQSEQARQPRKAD